MIWVSSLWNDPEYKQYTCRISRRLNSFLRCQERRYCRRNSQRSGILSMLENFKTISASLGDTAKTRWVESPLG
jgi:hypothetical protein